MPRVGSDAQGFASVREVAQLLQVTRATVYRLCRSGAIPSVRVGAIFKIPAEPFNELVERAFQAFARTNDDPNPEGAP